MITGNRSKTVKTLNILSSDFYICIIVFIWCTFSFKYFSTIWHISNGNGINSLSVLSFSDTKHQWARDDPAFLVLLSIWLSGMISGWLWTSIVMWQRILKTGACWSTFVKKNWSTLINFCKSTCGIVQYLFKLFSNFLFNLHWYVLCYAVNKNQVL